MLAFTLHQVGYALIFPTATLEGQTDHRYLHSGEPVLQGNKWIVGTWLMEHERHDREELEGVVDELWAAAGGRENAAAITQSLLVDRPASTSNDVGEAFNPFDPDSNPLRAKPSESGPYWLVLLLAIWGTYLSTTGFSWCTVDPSDPVLGWLSEAGSATCLELMNADTTPHIFLRF